MNDYQKEQLGALQLIRKYLPEIKDALFETVGESLSDYLVFRDETDRFLETHFSNRCNQSCYQNQLSACCSKDGIITFFADVVINVIYSDTNNLDRIEIRLQQPNSGSKCVYLTETGCLWRIKPIVCQMFLCDKAQEEVFLLNPSARTEWEVLKQRKEDFTWPDKPVLFDQIETIFMDGGSTSSLMYLHNSPGLLRLKQRAGLI